MKKVSVVVPCYNEEKTLRLFYDSLKNTIDALTMYEWEVLMVNDGSKDNTLYVMYELRHQDKRFNILNLSRNWGKENAMLAGFDYVTGDCMIIMDADLQDPPELIPQMLEYWEQGYEDVYAKRNDRGKESWLRKKMSMLFYQILDRSTSFDILRNVGDFRLLDRVCINALTQLRESERYTKGMFCWIGFKKKEVVFDRGDRIAGNSHWSFIKLFNLAIEGICSFTTAPLRFASICGAIIAFFSFLFMVFYISKTLIIGDPVQGFTTLISVMLLLGGVELLCIGILGEYIGRVFNETKQRPTYLVSDYNGEKIKNYNPHI